MLWLIGVYLNMPIFKLLLRIFNTAVIQSMWKYLYWQRYRKYRIVSNIKQTCISFNTIINECQLTKNTAKLYLNLKPIKQMETGYSRAFVMKAIPCFIVHFILKITLMKVV